MRRPSALWVVKMRPPETELTAALGALGAMQYQCVRNSVGKCLGRHGREYEAVKDVEIWRERYGNVKCVEREQEVGRGWELVVGDFDVMNQA